jgi:hypothetical protein
MMPELDKYLRDRTPFCALPRRTLAYLVQT